MNNYFEEHKKTDEEIEYGLLLAALEKNISSPIELLEENPVPGLSPTEKGRLTAALHMLAYDKAEINIILDSYESMYSLLPANDAESIYQMHLLTNTDIGSEILQCISNKTRNPMDE